MSFLTSLRVPEVASGNSLIKGEVVALKVACSHTNLTEQDGFSHVMKQRQHGDERDGHP